jgi:hypothetical protein
MHALHRKREREREEYQGKGSCATRRCLNFRVRCLENSCVLIILASCILAFSLCLGIHLHLNYHHPLFVHGSYRQQTVRYDNFVRHGLTTLSGRNRIHSLHTDALCRVDPLFRVSPYFIPLDDTRLVIVTNTNQSCLDIRTYPKPITMPTTGSRMGMVAMLPEVVMEMEEVAMPTMEATAMSPRTPKTTVSNSKFPRS